jgi:hypothetical protein
LNHHRRLRVQPRRQFRFTQRPTICLPTVNEPSAPKSPGGKQSRRTLAAPCYGLTTANGECGARLQG